MNGTVVIGAGSWGTTVAMLLCNSGGAATLVCREVEVASAINREHRNPRYMTQAQLPDSLIATTDLAGALENAGSVYCVVPTAYLRDAVSDHLAAWQQWSERAGSVLCNCSKGLLVAPTERSDDWLSRRLPAASLVHLSGPNLAAEIVAGQPAAAVVACDGTSAGFAAADVIQQQLSSEVFRVYTGPDRIGVEVAGFYKNIIAIAAGMLDGLRLGNNTRAVLITRGLVEMGRLVAYFGGTPATLHGLAGVGDLIVTCSSALSRNYQVGQRRAMGKSLSEILDGMNEVAEGVQASRAVHLWPQEHASDSGVMSRGQGEEARQQFPELPIAQQVYAVLHEGRDPREAIGQLMRRPLKSE